MITVTLLIIGIGQQFMKFVKKIGDGEISIKDNQVVNKSGEEIAQDWAQDFHKQQPEASAQDWAQDFHTEQSVSQRWGFGEVLDAYRY